MVVFLSGCKLGPAPLSVQSGDIRLTDGAEVTHHDEELQPEPVQPEEVKGCKEG